MNNHKEFDAGYTQGLMGLDSWIRSNLSPNTTVAKIRAELIEMLNDLAYGTLREEIDEARNRDND